MQAAQQILSRFSKNLFWDAQLNNIDLEEHKPYIVQRVLEYGTWDDWVLLNECYGLQKIVDIARQLRSLDGRALAYLCAVSHTPKEKFRCYILKQLNLQPWDY